MSNRTQQVIWTWLIILGVVFGGVLVAFWVQRGGVPWSTVIDWGWKALVILLLMDIRAGQRKSAADR